MQEGAIQRRVISRVDPMSTPIPHLPVDEFRILHLFLCSIPGYPKKMTHPFRPPRSPYFAFRHRLPSLDQLARGVKIPHPTLCPSGSRADGIEKS